MSNADGYKPNDNPNNFWFFKDEATAWSLVYKGYTIPDEIVEYLKKLAELFPARIENGEPCEKECDLLNRWLLLKIKALRYIIMRLQR
jgi:hypothetical protein